MKLLCVKKRSQYPYICLDFYLSQNQISICLPLFTTSVKADFPSPADDYIEQALDLNELVIQHPHSKFFVRVSGESMEKAGYLLRCYSSSRSFIRTCKWKMSQNKISPCYKTQWKELLLIKI